MQKQLKNVLTGGMDSDSDARAVVETDWRTSLNIRGGVAYAGKQGIITNVKGNEEIPYTLPAGSNKCIGAYQDIQANTILYFIWNSNGDCQILRYFADYNRIDLQVEYDFGWTADTNITGIELINGKLLYWLDPQPRKINIEKARLIEPTAIATDKIKKWNVIVPKTVANMTSPYILTFKNRAGATLFISVGDVVGIPDREQVVSYLASLLNSSPSCPVIAEACGQTLELTEKVANTVWTIECNQATLVVADNWYGAVMTDRMFDRGKWMPLYEPNPTYLQDDTVLYNYVRNKVFQFRLKYRYDDFENSALGVISQIPITNLQCDGTNAPEKNYIDVDFNDPAILEDTTLCILRDVTVLAREQNDGNWREIIQLPPVDFLDYDGTSWVASYNFYNNIVSNAVADADVAKQYDDVPLTAEENLLVKNRSILANVVKGYDAPDCLLAKPQMEFVEEPNRKLHKVTGLIRVFNYRLDNNSVLPPENTSPNILERRGAISYDTARTFGDVSYPFFGGYWISNSSLTINTDFAFDKKRQYLPEGGWAVYAAGTDYFTVSRQRNIDNVAQRADGSFDVSNNVNKDLVKKVYEEGLVDIYSSFELNLPDGEYVIRLASHWCSFGDKLGKGFMYNLSSGRNYQKTSTYVWGINNQFDGSGYRYDYEIKIIVSGADVYVGEFIVSDLVFPLLNDDNSVYPSHSGYLFDNFGKIDVPSLAKGTIVDRALVRNTIFTQASFYASYHQKITDHNGFFFTYPDADFNSSGYANRFLAIQVNGDIHNSGTQYYEDVNGKSALELLFNETITPSYPHDPIPSHLEIILPTDNPNARYESSTFISGTVSDTTGNPISNVTVLVNNGRYVETAIDGTYNLLVWGDMSNTPPYSPPVSLRNGYVIFSLDITCGGNYPSGQEVYFSIAPFNSNTTTTPPPYSPSAKYTDVDLVIDETNSPYIKAHKRGGNYIYGIRLYDELGRVCSVVRAFEMYVPFITEDIGRYGIEDFSGNIYASGTFKYGKPSVKWVLDSSTIFPVWATKLQWMRVKNSVYGRYLQWVANQVTYLAAVETETTPEIQTSFQNSDAVAIAISVSNIVTYQAANNNSQVGYSYVAGDRVRLIAGRTLINYDGLNDFEITSYNELTQSIIVKPNGFQSEILSGTLFEVFNPKSITDPQEQIFYEVGEVVEVNNGIPSSYSGVFTNGDTYWRGRTIIVNDEATKFASAYPVLIEDASVSDFYQSNSEDIGRAGVIDPNFKQIHFPTMMQNSNVYVEGSAINGLSSFESYNYKELNRAFGGIKRLFYVGNTLLSIHENKVVANYIELRSLSDANNTDGLLAVSNAYFGNDRPMQSEYGCQHPNSAVQYNGFVYFLDASKGVICRTDNNGLNSISDIKMRSYFRKLCAEGVTDAIGVFDPYYREYVVTIKTQKVVQQNPVIFNEETIAWGEDKNRWSTFYSFIPERYASVLRSIVSFVDGKFYLHDVSNTYNNFYGTQHRTELTVIPHTDDTKQTFHTVLLQGVQATPLVNDWGIENITNDYGQLSRLKKQHFRLKENFWAASFLRDLTDTTVVDPIINGRNLRGQELTCEFINDATELVSLQQIITTYVYSERTPK